jgi:hypothetical protein
MHAERRIMISFVLLFVVCGALALAVSRTLPSVSRSEPRIGNLSSALVVEIHDRASRRVLYGEFRPYASAVHEAVRVAPLMAFQGEAVGSAEIELIRHPNGTLVQELEIDVEGLSPHHVFDVVVDGQRVGPLSTDSRGAAEFERFGRVAEAAVRTGD